MHSHPIRTTNNAIDVTGDDNVLLALQDAVEKMKPGEICVYHRSTQEYVTAVLDAAWNYQEDGLVKLLQRKVKTHDGAFFEYLAVKTSQL
jgi:hypothetical protein